MTRQAFPSIIILLLMTFNASRSDILHVPGEYGSIQAAINAANPGDTVLVDPGTYFENLNFRGKDILLTSHYLFANDTSFISQTIIDGSHPTFPDSASCVLIISGETSSAILQGFTLTGGMGTRWPDSHIGGFYREGGGILTENSSPTIRYNRIIDNDATNTTNATSAGGGAIRSDNGDPHILNNVIAYNKGKYGGGIVLNFTGATIMNNIIAHNTGGEGFGGSGIWIYKDGPSPKLIENNTIVENVSALDGGGVRVAATSVTFHNNIVWGNVAATSAQIHVLSGTTDVAFCDVQGGWPGTGNVDVPPAFSCVGYYLTESSQCIDAGDASLTFADPARLDDPTLAAWPSKGSIRNDLGAYGGPGRGILGTLGSLSAPQLILPADRASDQPNSLTASWHPTDCGAPYHLQIGADSTFGVTVLDSFGIADTSCIVGGLPDKFVCYWRVQSADTSLGNVWSQRYSFVVGGSLRHTHFDEGWNMISLPLENARGDIIFPSSHSQGYAYNGTTYEPKDTLVHGVGYWMRFASTEDFTIISHAYTEDTIDVVAGWNMIGSIAESLSTDELVSIPADNITSFVYGFIGGYTRVNTILPFRGYWVKVNENGKLILQKTPGATPLIQHAGEAIDPAGTVTITDARGRSQALYIVSHDCSDAVLRRYELPPAMPAAFDVRFASGGILETVRGEGETVFQIVTSSVEYPITVRWEIRDADMHLVLRNDRTTTLLGPLHGSMRIRNSSSLTLRASLRPDVPREFALSQNYPNPFNPTTRIEYALPEDAIIRLTLHNVLGQEVSKLVDGVQSVGRHFIELNASALPSGIYYYRMSAAPVGDPAHSHTFTRKALLVK